MDTQSNLFGTRKVFTVSLSSPFLLVHIFLPLKLLHIQLCKALQHGRAVSKTLQFFLLGGAKGKQSKSGSLHYHPTTSREVS